MMTGLDTNVLVRYLVKDDAKQAEAASHAIRKIISAGQRCFINRIVMCELVWVLETAYSYSKKEIAAVLEMMLLTKQFEIESKDIIHQAVNDYRISGGDIADYIIGRINQTEGCATTLTFDRKLKASHAFKVIE